MMSAPVVCTEPSGSQKRPVMDFIERLSVRQQPRSQRWQHFRPVGNSTSRSQISNADHRGNERYEYAESESWVEVAHELQVTVESDQVVSPPNDVDNRTPVASVSQDTAGGVDQQGISGAQKECDRPAVFKHEPPVSMINIEDQIAPHRVRDKIRRAKTQTVRSISAAIPRLKRRYPSANEPIVTANTAQLVPPTLVHDEPPHSRTTQRGEKDASTIALLHAEGKQRKSADVRDTEQIARESEEIEKLRRDLSESQSRIAELQKRCEAQSRDLEGSNSFFNTADKSSDSDIIRALQRLNAEIEQNATYMAECLAEDFEFENLTVDPTGEQTSAMQRASGRIGRILAKSLRRNTLDDIPMLLQIALQAYLASVLRQAASSWAFEPGYNRFIHEIYRSLRSVEAQAVSGRWRSLARVHNVHSWITHPETLVKGILTDVSDIVLAAGCTAPQSDIITKVTSKFDEKINLLVELAGHLSKMFDEVISNDFEVFIARPGEKFKDRMMEDADDGQARTEEVLVLCATHIGLIKRVPVGTVWEKGKKQKIMVLKAKVLLESFLNTVLED